MKEDDLEKLKAMEFLGKIFAHDMRTPLSTLMMMLTSIDVEVNSSKIEVEKVSEKIQKSKSLLREILFFIKVKTTNLQAPVVAQTEKLNILEIIEEAIQKYPISEVEKSLISVNCEQNFFVTATRELILQIIFNLLENSLRQMRIFGKGSIEISIKSNEKYNKLYFKDTASHMPENESREMFKLNIDYSSSRAGVGLFFCKNAMLSIGGNIFYKACDGGFPEFVMIFPK